MPIRTHPVSWQITDQTTSFPELIPHAEFSKQENENKFHCRLNLHLVNQTFPPGGRLTHPYVTAVNFFSQLWACSIIVGKSFNSGSHPSFISWSLFAAIEAGSPARRGAWRISKSTPATLLTASTTSLTEYPRP